MKIVVLDGYCLNPGDLSWDALRKFGEVEVFDRTRADEVVTDESARGEREYLLTYLRSLDVEREGLPEGFRTRLANALAHYDVHDLERTPELEEAVYRIFLAQQRAPSQLPAARRSNGPYSA